MSFPFRIIPDAEGHPLRDPLAVWLTERYGPDITAAAGWVGKRVEFLVTRDDARLAEHNGKTGKVAAAALLLNDDQLFRYTVVLDKGGATVDGVAGGDFFFSALSDAEAGLSRGPGGTLTVTDPTTGKSQTVPIEGWEMRPHRRPVGRPVTRLKLGESAPRTSDAAVGRRVRVVDATRHPGTYLQEGFVSRVVVPFKTYGVRLNSGAYHDFDAGEVRFL